MHYVGGQTVAALEESGTKPVLDPVWRIEVDGATPAEWSQMLDLFDDANIYQTWSYGAVRWGRKNLSHLVLKRNDEVVGMAQLRIVCPAGLNFGMAYVRWGPLCHRKDHEIDAEVVRRMARVLHEEYVVRRRLLLQILPNAFEDSPRGALFQSAFSAFGQEARTSGNTYRTFVVDLTPPLDELRRKLDVKWRNKLTRSEKNGLKVASSNGSDQYEVFCRMYDEMLKRKAFKTTVNVEEFGRIQQDLPPSHRMRVLICEQAGIPVAGVVASAMGDSAIYLLGATSDEGLNAKGAYLLHWSMMVWLKENGYKRYDLGGIDPEGNPGVYSFKKGFSGTDLSHMTPLTACDSVLSSAIVKASLMAHRALRSAAALRLDRFPSSK